MPKRNEYREGLDIAIVGMTGRFPCASNIDEFYENLKEGRSGISFFDKQELIEYGVSKEDVENPNYICAKGVLESAEEFDNRFFGYTPVEAKVMDPQTRLMHECVWEALENAGYKVGEDDRLVGIYVGGSPSPMWEILTFLDDDIKGLNPFTKSILNNMDLMATRVSYKLNLKGPSIALFTSCSTSLVAIHTAVQALLSGECDIAVAGGVSAVYPNKQGYVYQEGMHLSSDGCCRSFDANASGVVISDAIGLLVLKRAEDAVADRDSIDALIIGSAINNDGSQKVGFTAPSVDGQEQVIKYALELAEAEPKDVSYVETHGSGTMLGDSIEIEALRRVFKKDEGAKLAIGTCKTNIGHTNSASGVVGVIKTVLSLKNKVLFPHINYETPLPELILPDNPFHIATKLEKLEDKGECLIAGVSSFGVGGTNAHLILKEYVEEETAHREQERDNVIVLSAKTPTALEHQKENFRTFLMKQKESEKDIALDDLAFTLQAGRAELEYRLAFAANSIDKVVEQLSAGQERGVCQGKAKEKLQYVWMFSGQGKQYLNMGRDLYESEPFFKDIMDECFDIARRFNGIDYKQYLYSEYLEDEGSLTDTAIVQPMLFCFEYALARYAKELGVPADYLIGYSFGEITAAAVAGIVSLDDAVKMAVTRGKVMKECQPGAVLSVPLPAKEVREILEETLSIAVDNGESCIVSGKKEDIDAFQKKLKQDRVLCFPLASEHAAHSKILNGAADAFLRVMDDVELREPKTQLVSCITGNVLTREEAENKHYWSEQMLHTVQFYNAIRNLPEGNEYVFVEFGPGRDLCNIVLRARTEEVHTVDLIPLTKTDVSDVTFFYNRLAKLWTIGTAINWDMLYQEEQEPRKIHLPSYPFEHNTFTYRKGLSDIKKVSEKEQAGRLANRDEWFYEPCWQQSRLLHEETQQTEEKQVWLLFGYKTELATMLSDRLNQQGQSVIFMEPGEEYQCVTPEHYRVNIEREEDFIAAVEAITKSDVKISFCLDLMPLENQEQQGDVLELKELEKNQVLGMYSLLHIVQAFASANKMNDMKWMIVTDSTVSITGMEQVQPGYATLAGISKVINQEFMNVQCACIDIEWNRLSTQEKHNLAKSLLNEFSVNTGLQEIAYRKKYRWIKNYARCEVSPKVCEQKSGFTKEGTYVILGGLGRIGFEIAKYIMQTYNGNIAVLTRSKILTKEELAILPDVKEKERVKSERLEELGRYGKISVYVADLGEYEQVNQAFDEIEKEYVKVNGVIHAAGVTGIETSRTVSVLSQEDCILQFKPKVYGLWVLERVLEGRELDFCLLCSSLSPILGGLGYGAYAGVSSFMDSFVFYHNQTHEQQWIDVNWETWLSEVELDGPMHAMGSYNAKLTLNVEEAMDLLERILCLEDFSQVVISTCSLEHRLKRWTQLEDDTAKEQGNEENEISYQARPQLLSEYVPPVTEVEKKLCQIWSTVLGIQGIGIKDNFMELGGDSLKLLNSIGVVYNEFNVDIPISDFFNNPFISYLAERIEQSTSSRECTILPAEKKEYYAVSSAQKRMFYLETLNKDSVTYNETKVFDLEGKINVSKIEEVFKQLIKRHEILRTSFEIMDEVPVQIIHDDVEFHIDYIELEGNEIDARSYVKPFQLNVAPLLRITLLKMGEEKHKLILDMNHIISDGVSEDILITEFLALYQEKQLEPLTLQYKDFTEWQNQRKLDEAMKQQEEYWLRKYSGEIPKLDLPYDHSRPKYKNYKGNSIDFILEKDATEQLKQIVKDQSVTLYVLMLSAYSIFLNKMSNAEDIVVGTNTSGRLQAETQSMLGMFVNTIALRLKPDGEKVFKDFLQEVRQEVLEAFENQDYQFDDLVEQTVKERDFSRNPIFDVAFVWENMDRLDIVVDGVRFVPCKYANDTSRFDMILYGYEYNNELVFRFEYDTNLFEESTINRFIHYVKHILRNMPACMDEKIKRISPLSEQDERELLDFNKSLSHAYENETIVTAFNHTVRNHGDNIAITDGAQCLTYKELNRRANGIANTLIERGVQKNSIVAVVLEREMDMVIAILGILKAGCSYLPINPDYPQSRIDYTIEDSETLVIVTKSDLAKKTDKNSRMMIFLDKLPEEQDERDPGIETSPSDLAYIIYTSGTTGKPKGVMIEHKCVVNLICNRDERLVFNEHDVWTLFHSDCFDLSVWEMFGSFFTGAKLVVMTKDEVKSPRTILEILERHKVTIFTQTPTAFENLLKLDAFVTSKEIALRYVIFGGEKLKPNCLKKFKELHDEVRLINMYGITETTVHVTFREYDKEAVEQEINDIGGPLPGYHMYIMNPYGQLAPIGVTGEICVSGLGLARGYLNREELTNERFIKNPYDETQRLYRSGDLAKVVAPGKIEYCGRRDHQVKIRGHRVELGEIEARILSCKPMESVRVIIRDDIINMDTICAYMVSKEDVDISELREDLRKFLPEYMIPAYFIQLDKFPLTSNGKIDVKALPKPELHADKLKVKPESTLEEELLTIWSETFNVNKEAVSVENSLFEIGGNSIIVVQLQRKMEQKYQLEIPITAFFQYVTIREMAKYIEELRNSQLKVDTEQTETNEEDNESNIQPVNRASRLRSRNLLARED